jgi:hypothetical protein
MSPPNSIFAKSAGKNKASSMFSATSSVLEHKSKKQNGGGCGDNTPIGNSLPDEYPNVQSNDLIGGKRRKTSKKSSNKATKKSSKKSSKKGSKKGSKKSGSKKKASKKGSAKLSRGGDNPIVLAGKIATALFTEFGEETNEVNAKGNKKWKLPDIQDGIPFRTTLGKILKENGGDLDKAISDAKKRYESGALQKAVKKTKEEQDAKKAAKKAAK